MVRGEWREYLGRGVTEEEEEEEEGKGNWKKGCRRWCNALCFDFSGILGVDPFIWSESKLQDFFRNPT